MRSWCIEFIFVARTFFWLFTTGLRLGSEGVRDAKALLSFFSLVAWFLITCGWWGGCFICKSIQLAKRHEIRFRDFCDQNLFGYCEQPSTTFYTQNTKIRQCFFSTLANIFSLEHWLKRNQTATNQWTLFSAPHISFGSVFVKPLYDEKKTFFIGYLHSKWFCISQTRIHSSIKKDEQEHKQKEQTLCGYTFTIAALFLFQFDACCLLLSFISFQFIRFFRNIFVLWAMISIAIG